jgi:adenylate cyclase
MAVNVTGNVTGNVTAPAPPLLHRLGTFLRRIGDLGTAGYSEETRRRLRLTNYGVYLIALTSINYAILYASYDAEQYRHVIVANLLLTLLAVWVPFSHRIHDHAGLISIAVVEYAAMFYLVSEIGRDAGIQLNYMIAAGAAFLFSDRRRLGLILSLVAGALVLHVAAWFLFPTGVLGVDPQLSATIYVNSAITAFGIIAFAVHYAFRQVALAKAETEALLRNTLPEQVVERLKAEPGRTIADSCDEASVLFADLVGFTPIAHRLGAERTVALLNRIFTHFDEIADELGVEKIKTIGDAYMAVAGLPQRQPDHVQRLAEMAIRMHRAIKEIAASEGIPIALRIGLDSGPVTAGVIGRRKFIYDVWGDAVNAASRLQAYGEPGKTQVSASLCDRLSTSFEIAPRGTIDIRGLGPRETCFLIGRKEGIKAA